jgi:hypothetical protein
MKWKISLCLAVIFIGSLAVLYASLLFYAFNRLKPDIVAAVKSATETNPEQCRIQDGACRGD